MDTQNNLFSKFVGKNVLLNLVEMDSDAFIEGKILLNDVLGVIVEETGTTGDYRGKTIHCYYPWTAIRVVQLAGETFKDLKAA